MTYRNRSRERVSGAIMDPPEVTPNVEFCSVTRGVNSWSDVFVELSDADGVLQHVE